MEDTASRRASGKCRVVIPNVYHVTNVPNIPNVFTFLCHNSSISPYFFKFFKTRDLTSIACVMAKRLSSSSPIWKRCLLSKFGTHASASLPLTQPQKIIALYHAILGSECFCNKSTSLENRYKCFKKNRQHFYDFIGLFVTKNNAKCLYSEMDKFVNVTIYHLTTKKLEWNIFTMHENCPLLNKMLLIFRLIFEKAKTNHTPDQISVLAHQISRSISLCAKNHHNKGFPVWLTASEIDLNASNCYKQTPLMEVARSGPVSIVRELIAAKAHVNAADCIGRTPLFYAIEGFASNRTRTGIVRELIAAKANVNMQDCAGRTALVPILRQQESSLEECLLLLAYGKHTHVVANCLVTSLIGCVEGFREMCNEKS